MALTIIIAFTLTARGQDAASDRAESLLEQGISQYEDMNFRLAKATLLKVDSQALSSGDKKTLEEYLNKVDTSIRKQAAAEEALEKGEKALSDNNLTEARDAFALASQSQYLPRESRKWAQAQLALVKKKLEIAAEAEAEKARADAENKSNEEQPAEKPEPENAVAVKTDEQPQPDETPEPIKAQPVAANESEDNNNDNKKENAAEADKTDKTAAARNKKAENLINQGKAAMADDEPEQAVKYFEMALDLNPDSATARRQLTRARQMAAQSKEPEILTRLQKKQQIAQQQANLKFEKAMKRSYEALAQAEDKEDFQQARTAAETARNIIDEAKEEGIYDPAEYRQKLLQVKDQLKWVGIQRDKWEKRQVKKQQEEIKQKEMARRRRERLEKQKKINTLTTRARNLTQEHQYDQALNVIEQILKLEPQNTWAQDRATLLGEFVMLQKEGDIHSTLRKQERQSILDVVESEIPWWQLIRYPKGWKELTMRRKPFGAAAAAETEADRMVRQRLREKLKELDFDGYRFDQVIGFLRDFTGLSIHVKWSVLENAGYTKEQTISIHLSNVPVEKALEVILEDIGGAVPGSRGLGYAIDEGVITISTVDDLAQNKVARVYDIRDLILHVPDFEGPPMDLSQITQARRTEEGGGGEEGLFGGEGMEEEEEAVTKKEIAEEIITQIKEVIAAKTGGTAELVSGISEMQGQLIVTQTPEIHDAIRNLLSQLREKRALQISIESRFIVVRSSFLNRIGVDLDFFFNLGSEIGSGTDRTITDPWTGDDATVTGPGRSGSTNKFTPIGVEQDSNSFTSLSNLATAQGGDIASSLTTNALSISGAFLDDFEVDFLIEATQADASSRTLTAPRLTLYNGQRAFVIVADQTAYVSDLESQVAAGGGVGGGDAGVAFRPEVSTVGTGSSLDVQATISSDRRYVTLTLRPTVATLDPDSLEPIGWGPGSTSVTGAQAFIQLPEVEVKTVKTTVSVPDGGTVLLGGQKLAGQVQREIGVPLLSKIPVLNRAFTNRGMAKDEETLLILVKPDIIIQQEEEEKAFP